MAESNQPKGKPNWKPLKLYRLRGLLFIVSIYVVFSCNSTDDQIRSFGGYELIKQDYSLNTATHFDQEFIGNIRDITTNKLGDLYLLDSRTLDVKRYDENGDMVQVYGHGSGKGPGEFLNPISVAVDTVGNVYVADMANNNINILSENNDVINQVNLDFVPARIIVDREQSIYVIGFPMTYSGDLIHKYELDNFGSYKKTKVFGERSTDIDQNLLSRVGNVDAINLDSSGNIYLSLWYPYDIRMYNQEGEKIYSYSRKVPFFDDPYMDDRGIANFTSGSWNIEPLDDGKVLNQYFHRKDGSWTFYYDIIDMENSIHVGMITDNDTELPEMGRLLSISLNNDMFIGTNHDLPEVLKYKIVQSE